MEISHGDSNLTHIGINAHLLSGQAGYRSAGIHGYIYNTLAHLAAAAPHDWRLTAMVGSGSTMQINGITMRRSAADTESPLRRILWEQLAQPGQMGDFDLYHGMAFVSPIWLRKPSVITVYDLSFVHYPQVLSPSRRLYLRLLTAFSCRRARRVIAISQSTARDLVDSLDISPDKIDVAVPGYDASIYRVLPPPQIADFRAHHHLPERFWLFLGTLEPRKNLPFLLEAYAALPTTERLPLILAGGKGWGYDAIFSAIERYNLSAQVRLPGYIPVEELPLWYNSAEVFIYPSIFEGFGIPVLEAMASGTPVITSNVSSLPEVAGSAGMCLPPDDVAAWTEALRRVHSDEEWRVDASRRGLAEAQGYSWLATAQKTVSSYMKALE
jgi:glycosyltransferase involved in cell wall biosynthesis